MRKDCMDDHVNDDVQLPEQSRRAKTLKPLVRGVLLIIFAVIVFGVVYIGRLFFTQYDQIYSPQRYESSYTALLPANTREITYTTSSGKQTVFYIPSEENTYSAPERLWILFNGNAVTALDWLDIIADLPDKQAGLLLIEYPGYGVCEGKPRAGKILESSEAAFQALARELRVSPERLEKNLCIMGYSIGSGTSLQFAAHHPIKRLILIAPFTSLVDMAALEVGPVLSRLVMERYDNRRRLNELAARNAPPDIHIFHGDKDTTVPFVMGKQLAEDHPGIITFHQIKGATHSDIFDLALDDLYNAMTEGTSGSIPED